MGISKRRIAWRAACWHLLPFMLLATARRSVKRPLPQMREFCAPLPLAAVTLLAVNDHWLKAAFHNAVTGKLSDISGCFFLPLFVSALLELTTELLPKARLLLGASVTTVLFTCVSTSRVAADFVCAALAPVGALFGLHGYRIACDPTDLIALPCVALSVVYGLQRTSHVPAQSSAF